MALLPQVELLSSDKTKLDSTKPKFLISIGIQEGKNYNSQDFSRKNYRKHAWLIEQPFYVDEPRWINIYPDMDISTTDNADPYILTRGKKIFKVKDVNEAEKMIENYEDFLNKYSSRSKRLSMKSRVRRSVEMKKISQNNTINDKKDQKKEINYYHFLQDTDLKNIMMTKSQDKKSYKIDKIFPEKYQKDKIKNVTEKLPYEFKIKQNRTSANDEKIINFVEQKNIQQEEMSNHIKNDKSAKINRVKKFNNRKSSLADINKRNKRSVLLKNKNFFEVPKKYKTREIDTNFEKNVEKNETNIYEPMKDKAYIDKLDDLDTYNDDTFMLFNKKSVVDNRTENSNEKDIDHNISIEKPWKSQYYAHKKLKSEEESRNDKNEPEIEKNNIEATQLTKKSESSRIKNYFNYRKKRNSACKACKIDPRMIQSQDQWLKDIEREIEDSSLERRNKHSDILDDLSLLNEPYVISRGKKASYKFENDIYSMSESRTLDDTDRIKVMSFPLAKALLKMLLMEMSGCNDCNTNVNRLSNKRSPRDRRGLLDEIFAAYDPYYVARGKRINLDNFLTKIQSLRKKSTSFETDEE